MLEKETERELTGPTKSTMKSRCFLVLDMAVRLTKGSIILSFKKVDRRRKKKSTRSDLLRVCLYLQGTVFSLLEGGF